ncbi:helix-turn-helix domain-containing protein [Leptospira kirschneri]|uniref:helix-turn-helix domain-containing protein n=1 Tax=Leptospira kirschneri TaxID=29507 RepID=UPI00398A70D9
MKALKDKFLGSRLREAREINGFTITDLAERLEITKQAVSQFESGKSYPSSETIIRISNILNFPLYFFSKPKDIPSLDSPVFFRSYSSATKFNRDRAKIKESWLMEITTFLRKYFSFPKPNIPEFEISDFENLTDEEIEDLATAVRKHWGLGNGPINNLVRLLEINGVIVSRVSVVNEIDAFSNWRSIFPIVILGTSKRSAVRSRFDAAHELGHLILHRNISDDVQKDKNLFKKIEKQADKFAGAFLLPMDSFSNELLSINIDFLKSLKSRWLVSMQSMVERAFHLKLISDSQRGNFYRNFTPYKKKEPLDDIIPFEQPILLSKSINMLVQSGVLNNYSIVNSLGLRISDIAELVNVEKDFFSTESKVLDFIN